MCLQIVKWKLSNKGAGRMENALVKEFKARLLIPLCNPRQFDAFLAAQCFVVVFCLNSSCLIKGTK